jgi:thioredoxin reductase
MSNTIQRQYTLHDGCQGRKADSGVHSVRRTEEHRGFAVSARALPSGFSVTAAATTSGAGILLLATGMRYELPRIEGVAEVWARGVYHCPYCHGWEVRDEPLAAYGAGAAHLALLLTSLSDDVMLLTDGNFDLDPDEAEQLRQAGVVVRPDPVARLAAEGGKLARVIFADGSSDDRTGLFFMPSFTPSPLPAQIGCELHESGAVEIDEDGRTSVPEVFAAGDTTTDKKGVVLAATAGSRAAFVVNAGLASGASRLTPR